MLPKFCYDGHIKITKKEDVKMYCKKMAAVSRKMKGMGFLLALMLMSSFMMQQNVSAYADTERFGDYEIYSSQMGDLQTMYSVFTPAQLKAYSETYLHHAIGPTFYLFATDVYQNTLTSYRTGQEITISFYRSGEIEGDEQAQVFSEYVGQNCGTKVWCSGWFSFTDSYGYRKYIVYLIEGWSADQPLSKLIDDNTWINSELNWLDLEYLGNGNLIRDQWDWIYGEQKCDLAAWLLVSPPREGVTVGFRFTDMYCNPIYPFY